MEKAIKMKSSLIRKRTPVEYVIYSISFVVFTLVAAFYLYIFVWCFMSGLKTHDDLIMHPFALPETWHFGNYIEIFSYLKVGRYTYFGMLFNSLYFSILGSFIMVMTTSMFAYVCNKYTFPCSKIFYPLILIMLTLPLYGSQGSMYLILKRLNFIDSYSQIFLAFGGMNMWFLYFTATYSGISDNYGEAAVIDGANDFQVYYKVMFPQARNLMLAMFLTHWVGDWNNYSGVLLYLPNIPTLAGGIYLCEKNMVYDVRFDMLYAAYFVSAVPPLVLFAFFSNILTNSISVGGVKE